MDRYIGLDVHAASTTIAVVGPSGKRVKEQVVETNGKALIEMLKLIPGQRHVCLEEGTQAEWLHEILKPHAEEIVVAKVESSRGAKSDRRDAFALAELLRTDGVTTRVFKDVGSFGALREACRVHTMVTNDVVRTKNRIKSMFRSRGIPTDSSVYSKRERSAWLKKLPTNKRVPAQALYDELDHQEELKDRCEEHLVREARRHAFCRKLETCPGFGPIRAAQLMAITITPQRFRTKRQFWSYCGLGIVMRSSSDWVRGVDNKWVRAKVATTRGLNFNHNHLAKHVLKAAATTVVAQKTSPLYADYQRLLDAGTKPNLAKLTIARRIAAIALAMWKRGEEYDPTKSSKLVS
jgi:transposase